MDAGQTDILPDILPDLLDDRYVVLDELGCGRMGRVLLVHEPLEPPGPPGDPARAERPPETAGSVPVEGSGRTFALKLLLDPTLRRAFHREFHVLRRLAHPAFVRAWDLALDRVSGRPYQLLEPVRGEPLTPGSIADPSRVVAIAAWLCRAVDHLHRLGWVHGDLAPPNLLHTGDDEAPLKVLDLGAAGRPGSGEGATSGVLAYAAPERLEGRPLSAEADLWSVGAVVFGLVHGCHPFPDYPSRVAPEGAPDRTGLAASPLDGWLDRLLSPRPKDRFPSAAAALSALEEATGTPLPLVPPADLRRRLALVPFVDVDGHLDELSSRLRNAADAGRPDSIRIGGLPGSGRSRLLEELAHRLAGAGVRVLRDRALARDEGAGVLGRLLARLDPGAAREEGPTAAARAILQAAREAGRPIALLVDDAGGAGEETSRALDFLTRTLARFPERAGGLLVVTAVDGPAERTLRPWTADDVEALLEALFPRRRVGKRVSGPLAEHARGLPAVLVRVLAELAGRGGLEVESGAVHLPGGAESLGSLPRSVEEAAAGALAALPQAARREAALLGHLDAPVPVALVGPAEVEALVAAGLAVRIEGPGSARLTLASENVAEAARSGEDAARADREWARRWAGLEGDEARVEVLLHRLRAGEGRARRDAVAALSDLPPRLAGRLVVVLADDAWPPAGTEALDAAAAAAAVGDLALAGRLLRRAAEEAGTEARALVRLGALEARQSRHPAAIEAFEAALSSPDAGVVRAEALAGLARSAVLTGRLDDAERWSEEGLATAGDDARSLRGGLRYSLGLVRWYRGQLDPAASILALAKEDVEAAGDDFERGAVVTALGLVAHRNGDLEGAAARYREALSLGEACGDDARVLTALQNLGVVLQERGAFTEALETYEEALELAEALGQTGRVLQLSGNLGHLFRYLGEIERARGVLDPALALARRESNRYMEGRILLLLGEIAREEESWAQADRLLGLAVVASGEAQAAAEEAEARIELGRLHVERQDYAAARREAERAAEVARGTGSRGLEAQATALLGAALGRSVHGDPERASGLVREAISGLESVRDLNERWPVLLEAFHDARRREAGTEVQAFAEEVQRILRQLEDAVPARHRAAFRRLRSRRTARLETTLLPGGPATRPAAAARPPSDERWTRLLEVTRRLSSEREVQRLLEFIMDSAVLLSGAERGFLLLDAAGDEMDVRVARNLDQENLRNTRFKISHGIARRVLETGEMAVTVDAMEDERYRDQLSVHDLKLRSVLCLPMTLRGKVLGAIYLDNRFRASAFGDADIEVLRAFCDQAAVALDNARLLEGLERSRRELEEAHREVAALNVQLEGELEARTRELEDSHKVVIRQQRELANRHQYDRIIGESDAIRAVFAIVDRLLDNDIPVLIEGESGTGKELVARAIHYNGSRKSKPFVAVNCGAIPANLLESELFGHVRGAFTGASTDKKGLFEAAHQGTLLLDELGELPLEMQVKLLRVLQSGEIKKVGSTREVQVDVRIVAATNRRLEDEVKRGRFREDLYYRLAVIPIRMPALRDRKGDIPLLVHHFLDAHREAGIGKVTGITQKAMSLLTRYPWPGNVRQLEMVLKNAALFAEGDVLEASDFEAVPELAASPAALPGGSTLAGRTLQDIEREAIIQALRDCRGNKKRAAEQLGIDRRTLYNKLGAYDIVVEKELLVS